MKKRSVWNRILAVCLAAVTAAGCALPARADEGIGDGVSPSYDEAYYAITDYYGNLTEGSVVKSYIVNGASALTDYGTYDEVINLTDGRAPSQRNGATTFTFNGDVPAHFYFEGKTAQPFQNFPWTISLSYTLNGVPTRAEELAGRTGVVEIMIDLIPNEGASEYARYNYTLEAMAMFNQDDILSLEAEGAQVQLIGNLRAVMFIALPGEEQHFTIRVGSEDFSFSGMTFLMAPATLAQLSEIAKLSRRKADLEEDYDKLSHSLDDLLDSLSNMEGSLYDTANGLDKLNQARDTVSTGKGQVYERADALRENLDELIDVLDPVGGQIDDAGQALSDAQSALRDVTSGITDLRGNMTALRDDLKDLRDNKGDILDVINNLSYMRRNLKDLRDSLWKARDSSISTVAAPSDLTSVEYLRDAMENLEKLQSAFDAADEDGNEKLTFEEFVAAAAIAGGDTSASTASSLLALYNDPSLITSDNVANYLKVVVLRMAFDRYSTNGATLTFEEFIQAILYANGLNSDDSEETAKSLWSIYGGANSNNDSGLNFQEFMIAAVILSQTQAGKTAEQAMAYAAENVPVLYAARVAPNPVTAATISGEKAGKLNAAYTAIMTACNSAGTNPVDASDSVKTLIITALVDSGSTEIEAKEAYTAVAQIYTMEQSFEHAGGADQALDSALSDDAVSLVTFQSFLNNVVIPASDGYDGKVEQGEKDASNLVILYRAYEQNPELIEKAFHDVDHTLSYLRGAVNGINNSIRSANSVISGLSRDAADVMEDLRDVLEDVGELDGLLDDSDTLAQDSELLLDKVPGILDDLDGLQAVLDDYEPKALEALESIRDLSSTVSGSAQDGGSFYDSFEDLLQTSGAQLDEGTRHSLSALASTLRKAAVSMSDTKDVRSAKDTIADIIEDTWDEYTGKVNNILMMDAEAECESLTDSRNPAPTSVQILIRSQEIKAEDEDAEAAEKVQAGQTTFWDRVKAMFSDLWDMITSIFH